MATTPKPLASGQAANSLTTVYTAPTGTSTRIAAFAITNTTAGALTYSVSLISATAGTARSVATTISIAAHETKSVTGAIGQVLSAGGIIQIGASAATSLDYYVSGYEIV